METKHLIPKEDKLKHLGDGPWVDEPDEVKFNHEGLDCYVLRVCAKEINGSIFGGHLCGYVVLPENCPKWGFWDVPVFEVHGGITFSGCLPTIDKYCIGFDCAHSWDIVPSMEIIYKEIRQLQEYKIFKDQMATYKGLGFVIEETKSLAKQVSDYLKEKAHD